MTKPRSQLISLQDTPYYHLVSRCVRRTFLCGEDKTTGKSYEHRRLWIEERIRILSSLFAVDICAYAVMSNHYHIVCKISPEQIKDLTDTEVYERWNCLYKGPILVQKWANGNPIHEAEQVVVDKCIKVYRERLSGISWFMKALNEPIARQANKEDNCKGHFWESRFKSQALFTNESLISAMAYTDLNPVRSDIAPTPEKSDHTSIKERIRPTLNLQKAVEEQIEQKVLLKFDLQLKPLLHFEGNITSNIQKGVLFSLKDYLELVARSYTYRQAAPRSMCSLH